MEKGISTDKPQSSVPTLHSGTSIATQGCDSSSEGCLCLLKTQLTENSWSPVWPSLPSVTLGHSESLQRASSRCKWFSPAPSRAWLPYLPHCLSQVFAQDTTANTDWKQTSFFPLWLFEHGGRAEQPWIYQCCPRWSLRVSSCDAYSWGDHFKMKADSSPEAFISNMNAQGASLHLVPGMKKSAFRYLLPPSPWVSNWDADPQTHRGSTSPGKTTGIRHDKTF